MPNLEGGNAYIDKLCVAIRTEESALVAVKAIQSLGQFGKLAKSACKLLRDAKTNTKEEVRRAASEALEKIEADIGEARP